MPNFEKTERPLGLRKTLFKHSFSDAHDCSIEWYVDFGKMSILLYSDFISPALLIDCLMHISHADERFERTGITSILQISNRFDIRLSVGSKATYKISVYKLSSGINEKLDRLEVELFPF